MGRYRIPDHVNHLILGHFPGESFEADIPAAQEARLLARGQIELVGGLAAMTRDELNQLATAAGVDDPDALPNKDAVVAAIENTTQKVGD